MIELTREVRCFLQRPAAGADRPPYANTWAGWPGAQRLAPFVVIRCTVRGAISPETDYVCNVKWLDEIVRDQIVRSRATWNPADPPRPMELAGEFYNSCRTRIAESSDLRLARIQIVVSPYLSYEIDSNEDYMIRVTHQYEFSASHRLHNPSMSDEDNRALYGKCHNPHGHGHNYIVALTWEWPRETAAGLALDRFDEIVKRTVTDRLDHRYLNVEVPPFDRLNPTVENIAVTIWQWLDGRFDQPARLQNVRVYETAKTWADYNGSGGTPRVYEGRG